MNESIAIFIEVQSLENTISKKLEEIKGEERRLEFVKEQLKRKNDEISAMLLSVESEKKIITKNESELQIVDKKIEQAKNNQKSARTTQEAMAVEKSLETLNPLKDQLEESIFSSLEKIEALEIKLSIDKKFATGAEESVAQIQQEVETFKKGKNDEMGELNKRIKSLLDSCSSSDQSLFNDLNKRFKYKNPVTKVKNSICVMCNYTLSRQLLSELERSGQIDFCSNCGRLLAV